MRRRRSRPRKTAPAAAEAVREPRPKSRGRKAGPEPPPKGDSKTILKELESIDRRFCSSREVRLGMALLFMILVGGTFCFYSKLGLAWAIVLAVFEIAGLIVGWKVFWDHQHKVGKAVIKKTLEYHELSREALFSQARKHARLRKKYDLLNLIDPELCEAQRAEDRGPADETPEDEDEEENEPEEEPEEDA